jgi:hypothetical protein
MRSERSRYLIYISMANWMEGRRNFRGSERTVIVDKNH